MKLIKTIILTLSILAFSSSTINAADLDCDNPKNFHAKMVCKLKGKSAGIEPNSEKKEPGTIGTFFKKIKNFGGKNIGKEG